MSCEKPGGLQKLHWKPFEAPVNKEMDKYCNEMFCVQSDDDSTTHKKQTSRNLVPPVGEGHYWLTLIMSTKRTFAILDIDLVIHTWLGEDIYNGESNTLVHLPKWMESIWLPVFVSNQCSMEMRIMGQNISELQLCYEWKLHEEANKISWQLKRLEGFLLTCKQFLSIFQIFLPSDLFKIHTKHNPGKQKYNLFFSRQKYSWITAYKFCRSEDFSLPVLLDTNGVRSLSAYYTLRFVFIGLMAKVCFMPLVWIANYLARIFVGLSVSHGLVGLCGL